MDPIFSTVGSAIALIVGMYLKRKPEFSNKLIPWVTLAISFLTQLSAAATAQAAGFFDVLGAHFGNVLVNTLVQWLGTTGLHSTVKNAVFKK